MKQPLWILNSSLLAIFIIVLILQQFLRKEFHPPRKRVFRGEIALEEEGRLSKAKIKKIYEQDLFDTYVPPKEAPPSELIPPLPSPKSPELKPPPPPKKAEFLPPLAITLKGIMFSSDSSKSIVLLADETGKEESYALGEKIKDAQVIKISRDRIALLRENGQQETLFLRKDENRLKEAKEKWLSIVKKVNQTDFEVDLENFKKEVPTLGDLLESLSLATAYENESAIGVRIGNINESNIGNVLGLETNDIIIAVNSINVATTEDRIEALSFMGKSKLDDEIILHIRRKQTPMMLSYKLTHLKPIKKPPFGKGPEPDEAAIKAGLFKLSREQQRMQNQRKFTEKHTQKSRQETIEEIRRQLLENMKRRQLNSRTR